MSQSRDTSTTVIFSDANEDVVLTLRSLILAAFIFVMSVAIIIANVLLIATFINFRGIYTYFNK